MYGVIDTAPCALPNGQQQAWQGHLCGQCLGLQYSFGHASRLVTSYDAALVIALCEAQSEDAFPKKNSLCFLRKPFTAPVDDPALSAVQYACGVALLAAANKIRDNLIDDAAWLQGLRRSARRFADRWWQAAGDSLAKSGFDAGLIERQFARQPVVEATSAGDFAFYSQPTELAVGAVFAHTAILQRRPNNAAALFEIGRSFGGIMLLLDASRDYERDQKTGCYNALAASTEASEWRQSARSLFKHFHSQLRDAFDCLELPQPGLLQTLLLAQLGKIGCHSLSPCQCSGSQRLDKSQPAQLGTEADSSSLSAWILNRKGDDQPTIGDPFPEDSRLCSPRNCCRCGDRCKCGKNLASNSPGADWCYFCHCPGGCDCRGCDGCGDCSPPGCSRCNSENWDCSNCGICDCGSCDCGACDCGNCDCGGCDCNC